MDKTDDIYSIDRITPSYLKIERYIHERDKDVDFFLMSNMIDTDLYEGLNLFLYEECEPLVNEQTSNLDIHKITEEVFEKTSNWDVRLKCLLDVVLVNRILENKELFNGNERVTKELLETLFKFSHTEDLIFHLLSSQRDLIRNS